MPRQLNSQLSLGQHWIWKRMAVKWAAAGPGDRVLDVCCGTGDLSYLLAKAVGLNGQVRQQPGRQCSWHLTAALGFAQGST